jgi:hypothetical protein
MTMKHSTKFQVSTISHLGGEESARYFKSSTPLGSTITQRKIMDPPVLTICTFTNDNEAFHKVSSLYNQPSRRRSEHKLFQTLHPSLIHHNSKEKLLDPTVLTICTSTNDNEALYKASSLYGQPSRRRSEHKIL